MISDESLYAGVQTGDREALAELIERYQAALFKFLFRLTGSENTAEDLVQEAFIRMITYRGNPPQRFKGWAFTIACNLARDKFRSPVYRRESTVDFEEEDGHSLWEVASGPEDLALEHDDRQQVMRGILRLSPPMREVLILRFYHDLPLGEIAEITSVPLGTVKSRLYHALKQVKNQFEREECRL